MIWDCYIRQSAARTEIENEASYQKVFPDKREALRPLLFPRRVLMV